MLDEFAELDVEEGMRVMNGLDPQIREEISANERWFAGFETPGADEASLGKIKQAVREELVCRQGESSRKQRPAWHGVLAAAAAIGLCVTAGWYSVHVGWSSTGSHGTAWPTVTTGESAVDAFERSIEALASTNEDLAALEVMTSDSAWALSGTALYEALEDAVSDDAAEKTNEMGVFLHLESGPGDWEVV